MSGRFTHARRHGCAIAIVTALALAATASATSAATHDYCNWDGSNCANAANTLYFAQDDEALTDNAAYLVFLPTVPTIFCGAYRSGVQYASYATGNPSCDHPYSGANLLKADEYVNTAAVTHGVITY